MNSREYRDRYDFGGNREKAILRDKEKCDNCDMTREDHLKKYGRDITVDHIDGNGRYTAKHLRNNNLDNLRTLCIPCHSRKDNKLKKLSEMQVFNIRHMRGELSTYKIAELYNVTPETISLIHTGKLHRHLLPINKQQGR